MPPHEPHFALALMPTGYEWIVILVIAFLIFGSKLPTLMRGLGSSIQEFKNGVQGSSDVPNKPTVPEAVVRAAPETDRAS